MKCKINIEIDECENDLREIRVLLLDNGKHEIKVVPEVKKQSNKNKDEIRVKDIPPEMNASF